jgi:hypothetical protein
LSKLRRHVSIPWMSFVAGSRLCIAKAQVKSYALEDPTRVGNLIKRTIAFEPRRNRIRRIKETSTSPCQRCSLGADSLVEGGADGEQQRRPRNSGSIEPARLVTLRAMLLSREDGFRMNLKNYARKFVTNQPPSTITRQNGPVVWFAPCLPSFGGSRQSVVGGTGRLNLYHQPRETRL